MFLRFEVAEWHFWGVGACEVYSLLCEIRRLLRGSRVKIRITDPESRSVLGILFTFWVLGFLVYEQEGSFFSS